LIFIPLSLLSHDISNLYNDRYWHTLLHFKNGKSEIDDKKFFLSSYGKQNPKAELQATIDALLKDKNKTFCKFPSRSMWLLEKLPTLKDEIGEYSCQEIDKIIKDYNPKSISLIFPTAHINSPASMYGHSFLRVDNGSKTTLLSQAINYAAQTQESNGLLFAYNGLTGGYEGRYSITPYYNKIKEYNDMERRDIWEYELNLSEEEILKLLYHQFEIKDYYADYFFFTENCSYNLLWLLQVARADVELVDKFGIKAIPIDTIRAVNDADFIKSVSFRPSKSKKIKEIIKKIDDIKVANRFLENGYKPKIIKEQNEQQKAYILDLSSGMIRYKRAKNKIEKKEYIKDLMTILKQRSEVDFKSEYPVLKPARPLEGHKTSRVQILGSEDSFLLSFKPSFHDVYDVERGYIEGAYINFFDLALKKDKGKDIKFEKFDIVNISSYAPREMFFKSYSWEVLFGFERNYLDKMQFQLKGGAGFSYKSFGFLYYIFLDPAFYIGDDFSVSLSPKVGIIKNFLHLKIGANAQREFFSNGDEITHGEIFSTYSLLKDISLNLKYDINGDKKRGSISLFYYF
jgi:hypothetical protein